LSKRLASTQVAQVSRGMPLKLPRRFVQLLPPSRVSCTLPSSVPIHKTLPSSGDSLIE